MVSFETVLPEHVELAIEECDELGADTFRRRYGFGQPREYVLWHEGVGYDSKAILGVAQKHATGSAARASQFTGPKAGAALGGLGFEVTPETLDAETAPGKGFEEWSEAAEVGLDVARSAWAVAARDVLIATAGRYRAVVTYKELAGLVQMRTGIRATQQLHHWVGDVLRRVSRDCASRGEPLLSSLAVNAQGSVGPTYASLVQELRGETVDDGDDAAAQERLACYTFFGAELPEGGGSAALTPAIAAQRSRARKVVRQERPANVCPTCNMAVPPTGVCDNCG